MTLRLVEKLIEMRTVFNFVVIDYLSLICSYLVNLQFLGPMADWLVDTGFNHVYDIGNFLKKSIPENWMSGTRLNSLFTPYLRSKWMIFIKWNYHRRREK